MTRALPTMARRGALAALACCALVIGADTARADEFTYHPAGDLAPGSGSGREDERTYVPGMRFPIEVAPAYANSQVWGRGGLNGGGGSQCDAINYAYPWRDNFCETRTWDMPLCPSGQGHQGQDIRPSTCADAVHWAVAAEAGQITYIGSYSLNLTADSGTLHRYLHMDPGSIVVSVGNRVERGARLGRISDAFGDSSTSIHLHYDIQQSVSGVGFVFVPTYQSLIDSYEVLIGAPGSTCEPFAGGAEVVIDNKSPCFVQHGPPTTWRYVVGEGYDGDLLWTYAWANDASNWAEWTFELEEAGEYELSLYVTPAYAQAQEARYTVRHAGGEEELRVDLSGTDGWLSVGTWSFAAGTTQRVAVYDGPGEDISLQRRVVADALRLTPVPPAVVEPEPDLGVPGDDLGGTTDAGTDAGGEDLGGRPDTGADLSGRDGGADLARDSGPDPSDTGSRGPDARRDDGGSEAESSSSRAVTVGGGCAVAPGDAGAPATPPAWPAWLLLTALLAGLGRRSRHAQGRRGRVRAHERSHHERRAA